MWLRSHANDAMNQVLGATKAKAGGPITLYWPIFCHVERMGICNVPLEITTLPSKTKTKTKTKIESTAKFVGSVPLHLSLFPPPVSCSSSHTGRPVPDAPRRQLKK